MTPTYSLLVVKKTRWQFQRNAVKGIYLLKYNGAIVVVKGTLKQR